MPIIKNTHILPQKFPVRLAILPTLLVSWVGVACANPPPTAQNYQNDHSVRYFNDAERTLGRGYEGSMQGGLFEMYPAYWQLSTNLGSQSPQAIANFANLYTGSVMAEKLTADYAEKKAEQSDYPAVRAVANFVHNADDSEACAVALGFNQSNESHRALSQKDAVWLHTQKMPALCDKLADEMAYNPNINRTDQHERLIRLMRIDGRRLSSSRPADNKTSQIVALSQRLNLPLTYGTLASIKSNPNHFFVQFANSPYNEVNQYLYIYAISQLVHRSYDMALRQLEYDIAMDNNRQRRLIGDMARRYAYRSIAVGRMNMTTDHGFDGGAVTWFRQSLGEPFNFEEAEDYAQAAIYFGQWVDVQNAIAVMTVAKQNERIWRYWYARSLEGQGKRNEAVQLYRQLTDEIDYYGLLARDRLGQALTLADIGGNQMPYADGNLVMADPHFARAFLLMNHNAKSSYIDREWNWAVKKAREANNHALLISASRMAHDRGNYPRSIYALQNSPARNAALSHPVLFWSSMERHSRNAGIDPAWAYGIIRQESRFQTAAQSGKSAQGLMQIIPSTARLIARSLGESVGNMNNPDTNIRYGTRFLADLAGQFGGQLAPATAGYNAGPGKAKAWLPKTHTMSADQYVEAIPYSETRDYVKHVMENTAIYSVALGRPVPISQRMGTVSPAY